MKKNIEIKWKYQKGKSFEDLICQLLKCMFPNITFKQTDYVHDGGKDFYSIGNLSEETIWIEAKNYQNHLELSKFSNTFIMADISEINHIIIFSMSEITKGARINVGRYASYHNKTISVYSGYDVLFLINKYRDIISLNDYIENLKDIDSKLKEYERDFDSLSINFDYYRAKQFNLAYRRNVESYIKLNEISNLPLNTLIAQEIHITNHDLFHNKRVFLDYSEYDSLHIETFFYKHPQDSIVVPPASTYVLVIFLKIIDFVGNFKLPTVKFSNTDVNIKNNSCELECCWLGEIPYIGKAWEDLQNTISLVENDIGKKIIIVEGKSGVGKTRFLEEISGYFFRTGCRIISLDFRSINSTSLKSVLQCILNNIYVLDDIYNEKGFFINGFNELYMDFYNILFEDSYDCKKNSDRIINLMISLFVRKNIVLLVDNVQDVSSEAIDFFEKMLLYVNNEFKKYIHIVLCFNQDYLYQDNAAYRLLSYIKQLSSSHLIKLKNFSKEDARLYLRENLDAQGLRLDLYDYFDKIINRFGTNPFVLKNLMLYLKQRGIIDFIDATIYISDFEKMKSVLSELPEGIENILQYRYTHLCHKINQENSNELDRIIWTILFLGELKVHWVTMIKLQTDIIQILADYGFIEYNEKSEIVFSHQLIEKSFCIMFSSRKYTRRPHLNFINDEEFLEQLFTVIDRVGRISLPIENMLLRSRLNKMTEESFNSALKQLVTTSPRVIMIPLIINILTDCLNEGIKTDPTIEIQALYSLSMTCQEKIDVNYAAEYTKNLVLFEQETYKSKLSAREELINFFKNYVFQLPIEKKYAFLDWFIKEAIHFELTEEKYQLLMGWIYNRYSKNLCSEHRFSEAEMYAIDSLKIALEKKDYLSAAQAEIEYGNIYAYNDVQKTVQHWDNCVKYISKYDNISTYFDIYMLGYDILCDLLTCDISNDIYNKLKLLLAKREQTFLYQQLYIDDIYANYYIIQYLDGKCTFETFKDILPKLIQMKSDSYMHTSKFVTLATYKLFTVYRLLSEKEPSTANKDIILSCVYELIDNGIFTDSKLQYSEFILFEIYSLYKNNDVVYSCIKNKLPNKAQKVFQCMNQAEYSKKYKYAVTPLSNKGRQVNLLHFNYVF